jgi:hypothetical protein
MALWPPSPALRGRLLPLFGLGLLALICWLVYRTISWLIGQWAQLPQPVAAAVATGAFTVLAATATVVAGKVYERRKDREALYRDKKVEIYDDFLRHLFALFNSQAKEDSPPQDFGAFIAQWNPKIILWGGPDVLKAYADWFRRIRRGDVTVGSVLETETLFRALRRDLGHNDRSLPKGSITHMWLRDSELILYAAQLNLNFPLSKISEIVALTDQPATNQTERSGTAPTGQPQDTR